MANLTDTHDNDCEDEVQEYELEDADDDDLGRLVLQPGKFPQTSSELSISVFFSLFI